MAAAKRKLNHSTTPDVDSLSINDIRFCQHYAERDNATEAYKLAGYRNSTASESAVGKAAWVLVRKRKIRDYVRQLREQACDAASVTVNLLAQGFKRVGFADRRGVFGPDGCMLPPEFWPEELGSILAGMEVEDLEEWDDEQKCKVKIGRKWKVKFERSMEARKILAQWRGMIGTDATVKDLEQLVKTIRGVEPEKV